jgi:hypothetical protein
LSAFGITRGQIPADGGGFHGSTNGVNKHLECVHRLPAKFKDTLTSGSVQASKIRRNEVITEDEDKAQPWKKKSKNRLLAGGEPDTDAERVSLNKGPNQVNTCVFPQASEDAQDTCTNTEVSSNRDNLGNMSTGEANTSDTKGCASDDEEWGYLQLDKMANKDAQVRTRITTKLL